MAKQKVNGVRDQVADEDAVKRVAEAIALKHNQGFDEQAKAAIAAYLGKSVAFGGNGPNERGAV